MQIGNYHFDFTKQTVIMGILNVTPDSFSDGGKFTKVEMAVAQALRMIEKGAEIIDIGGESTRPGHDSISAQEEISRVVPVIQAIRQITDVPLSIDTSKAEVAEAAIVAGASMINDIWGFQKDEKMAQIASQYQVPCCIMHNRAIAQYTHLIDEIIADLKQSLAIAEKWGINKEQIIIDPGIGFGKSLSDNLTVMRHLDQICALGYPVLLGASRKSMIGLTLGLPVEQRLEGTLATTVWAVNKGCQIIRVHDVLENVRAVKMAVAMKG